MRYLVLQKLYLCLGMGDNGEDPLEAVYIVKANSVDDLYNKMKDKLPGEGVLDPYYYFEYKEITYGDDKNFIKIDTDDITGNCLDDFVDTSKCM